MVEDDDPPPLRVRRFVNTSLDSLHWYVQVNGTEFPHERSLLDRVLFRKEGYREPDEPVEDYVKRMVEEGFVLVKNGHFYVVHGEIGLEFKVVEQDNYTFDSRRHHEFTLIYGGWRPAEEIEGRDNIKPEEIEFEEDS